MKPPRHYLVACKDNGIYVLATHRTFPTYTDAALYLQSIAVSREAIIILVD